MNEVRLLIADDHALFRQGLKALLAKQDKHYEIVGEVGTVDAITGAISKTRPDLILLDLDLDRNVLLDLASFAAQTKVVIVTADEDEETALVCIKSGACGVVFKRQAVDDLVRALDACAGGQVWMPSALQTAMVDRFRPSAVDPLTAREREVVGLVAAGLKNAEIAKRLFVSEDAVKKHISRIFAKLQMRDRPALILYGLRAGLAKLGRGQPRP